MNENNTLLVVDDSREYLALLVELLTREGYRVQTAGSGEQALEAASTTTPDLILLDLRMQGMDGLEVCRRLQAQPETQHIPIILMSAFTHSNEWVEGLELGAVDYIAKPFEHTELLTRVKNHLRLTGAVHAHEKQAAALSRANAQLRSEIVARRHGEDDLHRSLDRSEHARRAMLSMLEDQKQAEELILEQNKQINLLYQASQQLNRTLDLNEINQAICDFMSRIVPNDGFVLSAYDAETQQITCRAYWMDNAWLDVTGFPPIPLEPEGRGTQSMVIRSGQSLLLNDYQANLKSAQTSYYVNGTTIEPVTELPPDEEIPRSAIIVPLKSSGRVTGILQVLSYRPNAFTEQHLKLLESLALHIASAEQNGHLYAQVQTELNERKRTEAVLRRRFAELEAVAKISNVLHIVQTKQETLTILLDETLNALDCEAGVILLYDPEHHELRPAVVRGLFEPLTELTIRPGQGIAGTVFATEQVHITHEYATDPLGSGSIATQLPPGWGGICIPIRAAMGIGVMCIAVPLPREISAQEVKLLISLAEIAGTAIHRQRLHSDVQRRLAQMQALHNIDVAISSGLDLILTLSIVIDKVAEHVPIDAADVLLLDSTSGLLNFAAGRGFRLHGSQRASVHVGNAYTRRAMLEQQIVRVSDAGTTADFLQPSPMPVGEGFVDYLAVPLIVKGQVKGVLELYHRTPVVADAEWMEFLNALAAQAAIAIDNATLFDHLQLSRLEVVSAYDATIRGWSHALDLRDRETEGHSQRVTDLALRLARAFGIAEEEIVHIRRGALLHDIGKMGVPDEILHKPGKLTEQEWVIMKKHPALAFELLSGIAYLKPALDIPYCHHEKWDGTGYPRGLKEGQIPLAARLFAIADVWDATTSDRAYRKAWTPEQARENICRERGKHFDPQVVDIFFKMLDTDTRMAGQPATQPGLLIVDDEENITRSLERSLRDEFRIYTASSAQEALEILGREEIGVILVDQRMPGLTGLDLLRTANEIRPNTLGLLLSGYADADAQRRTLNLANVRGFLPKPWDMSILRQQLNNTMREYAGLTRSLAFGGGDG